MTLDLYFVVVAFMFGAVVGSFLNVCIVRIPMNKSIITPFSHCPKCKADIKAYDNIPLLSYFILRGKCRNCGEKIHFRYPLIELLTAFFSVACLAHFGLTLSFVFYFPLVCALVVITFIDLDHRIIPDVISLPGIIAGFALSFILPDLKWTESAIGILAGGGSLLMVAVVYEALTGEEGMGGGDIKLLAMMGAFLGWKGVIFTIMASSLLGTVIGGTVMLASGKGRKFAIPFGPFLSAAGILYIFWGDYLINLYLTLFIARKS